MTFLQDSVPQVQDIVSPLCLPGSIFELYLHLRNLACLRKLNCDLSVYTTKNPQCHTAQQVWNILQVSASFEEDDRKKVFFVPLFQPTLSND